MKQLNHKSTAIISPTRLRKIEVILANRWLETWEIVEARNSAQKHFCQSCDFRIDQISL